MTLNSKLIVLNVNKLTNNTINSSSLLIRGYMYKSSYNLLAKFITSFQKKLEEKICLREESIDKIIFLNTRKAFIHFFKMYVIIYSLNGVIRKNKNTKIKYCYEVLKNIEELATYIIFEYEKISKIIQK